MLLIWNVKFVKGYSFVLCCCCGGGGVNIKADIGWGKSVTVIEEFMEISFKVLNMICYHLCPEWKRGKETLARKTLDVQLWNDC